MSRRIAGFVFIAVVALIGVWLWVSDGSRAPVQPPQPEPSAEIAVKTAEEYALIRTVDPEVKGLKGIALDAQDNLYAAGAAGVKVWSPEGKLLREWPLSEPATCIALDGEANLYVGHLARVEVFDREGKLIKSFGKEGRDGGELNCVTAIAVFPRSAGTPVTDILVADAGNRCIHHFDMTGDFIADVGKPDRDAGLPGLVCPSAYLGLAVDESGTLHVTNPGLTRVERYSLDGKLLGFWGEGGNEPQQFSGCCNPTKPSFTWPRLRFIRRGWNNSSPGGTRTCGRACNSFLRIAACWFCAHVPRAS